jgi:hypothetical protein
LMRILVICNSQHHSRNTLQLAEQLIYMAGRGEVIALCERGEENHFESWCDTRLTRVFPFSPATLEAVATTEVDSLNRPVNAESGTAKFLEHFYYCVASIRSQSKSEIVKKLIDFSRNTTLGCYLQQRRAIRHFRTQVELADQLIKLFSPTIVLAFGDRHIDLELPLLVSAHRHKIRILLPYSTYSGVAGMVKIREIQGHHGMWRPFSFYRLYVALRLTKQIRNGQFWQSPSILMALHKLKLLTSNPWCIGNGPADIVCVDNAETLERYAAEGVSRNKLRIVGDTAYDALYGSFAARNDLRAKMISNGLIDVGRKTVVIALPQFAEQGLMEWPEHWLEIEKLLSSVCECGHNVIVSLHPRVNSKDYRHLESKYPICITKDSLKDILPVADVFVATNSSTVFWSVLCGIPVVVLDYFGLDSSLFAGLKSIVYVRNYTHVSEEVLKVFSDSGPDFSADWRRLSRDQVFDGQVKRRYFELMGT